MKIFFWKKGAGKSNGQKKILITIILSCTILTTFFMINQPAAIWHENDEWQIKVYQKGDQMMSSPSPWLLINELRMDLTWGEEGGADWRLQVRDVGDNELFPGISSLVIYYGTDLKITHGYALNKENREVMNINEFFQLSLYGAEFFSLSKKKYHHFFIMVKDQWPVELCDEKGRTVWWDKDHPWWIQYESKNPHLKAKLQLE